MAEKIGFAAERKAVLHRPAGLGKHGVAQRAAVRPGKEALRREAQHGAVRRGVVRGEVIVKNGLAEILEEVAGVTPADATPEKSFTDDLDVDSLSMVEIATAVEDKFGVAIPDDELGNIKTVGDALNYIEKNQG